MRTSERHHHNQTDRWRNISLSTHLKCAAQQVSIHYEFSFGFVAAFLADSDSAIRVNFKLRLNWCEQAMSSDSNVPELTYLNTFRNPDACAKNVK